MAYRLLGYRLGFLLLAAIAVAGCFTGPVNMRPTVQIHPPSRVFRGLPATYTATVVDPDNDSWTLAWAAMEGSCPMNFKAPEAWPSREEWGTAEKGPTEKPFEVKAPLTRKLYCVWAKATDAHGAVAVATWDQIPENHAPVPRIELVRSSFAALDGVPDTFPVHTSFMFSGAGTTDEDAGDPRVFEFNVRPSPPITVTAEECDTPDDALFCFKADLVADYVVELKFSDCDPHVPAELSSNCEKGVVVAKEIHVVTGKPPMAKLKLEAPVVTAAALPSSEPRKFPLGTSFRVSAMESTHAFPATSGVLTYEWNPDFSGAPATSAKLIMCPDDNSQYLRCFRADAPGIYKVQVLVFDEPTNKSAPDELSFEVLPDAMPCLGMLRPVEIPAFKTGGTAGVAKEFGVGTVDDDLDPFPPQTSFTDTVKFDWFLDKGQGKFELRSTDSNDNTFSIPGIDSHPGDKMRVRVQIHDRDTQRSKLAFDQCGDAAPSCSSAPGCYQRWTFEVNFNQ